MRACCFEVLRVNQPVYLALLLPDYGDRVTEISDSCLNLHGWSPENTSLYLIPVKAPVLKANMLKRQCFPLLLSTWKRKQIQLRNVVLFEMSDDVQSPEIEQK